MQPHLEVLEESFQIQIDEVLVDYALSYDVTGCVYACKALIFDLLLPAQKMILDWFHQK